MVETVLLGIAVAIIVSAFLALYVWTKRSESGIDWDHPGLSDEQANALRFGVAMTVNQNNIGL